MLLMSGNFGEFISFTMSQKDAEERFINLVPAVDYQSPSKPELHPVTDTWSPLNSTLPSPYSSPAPPFCADPSSEAESENENWTFFYTMLWVYFAPSIFIVISAVGVVGNLLVVYVIVSTPRMRGKVTNLFLLNLAVSDLAFLLICVPASAYRYAAATWNFSKLICQIVSFLSYVTAYVTIYTLVAISILRYVTVVHSHETLAYRNHRNAVCFIASLWLLMILFNIPTLLVHTLKRPQQDYTYCGAEAYAVGPIIYTFFTFAYLLPLALICLLYVNIARYLRSSQPTTIDQRQAQARTVRTLKVIALVVCAFGITWLPYHINQLLAQLQLIPAGPYYEVFRIGCSCLSFSNSCVNPFIYHRASEDFRLAFQASVGAVFKRCACGICRCLEKRRPEEEGDDGTAGVVVGGLGERVAGEAEGMNDCGSGRNTASSRISSI